MQPLLRWLRGVGPGLSFCVALSAAAILFPELPALQGKLLVSPLLTVILLGIAIRSFANLPESLSEGLKFAQRPLLRWAVAGLGFKLSIQELVRIGGPALAVVTVSTVAALAFGAWLGRRAGLQFKLNALLTVGSSICGASAVVATDSVVHAEKRDSAVALGTITLLGTLGIIVYPILGRWLGLSDLAYGVWDGASLHEMAQVVAAGHGFSETAAEYATVAKLARICLLAPVVLGLAWWMSRADHHEHKAKVDVVPWFLVAFIAFVVLNSVGVLTKDTVAALNRLDLWLLTAGMAGVGLQTSLREIREAGSRPLWVGLIHWVALAALSLLLAKVFCG